MPNCSSNHNKGSNRRVIQRSLTKISIRTNPKTPYFKSHSMSELGTLHKNKAAKKRRHTSMSENFQSRERVCQKNVHGNYYNNNNNNKNIYGHRYFYGKYGNKYGTHKKLQRHHNKMHRPFRLVDIKSIRYGVSYLLQRVLDVFMLCWFICGNYWVFNAIDDENRVSNPFNSTTNSSFLNHTHHSSHKVKTNAADSRHALKKAYKLHKNQIARQNHNVRLQHKMAPSHAKQDRSLDIMLNLTLVNKLISPLTNLTNLTTNSVELNKICYQTAFFQIIATYSLFALIVIFIFSYRLYALICYKKVVACSRNGFSARGNRQTAHATQSQKHTPTKFTHKSSKSSAKGCAIQ